MALDREKLRERLAEMKLSPRALSLRVGDNPYLVRDILSGKSQNPRSDTLARIAAELDFASGDLTGDGGSSRAEETVLPVLEPIRAGTWLEMDDRQDEPMPRPITLDRRYPYARQWLRNVTGDSMTARRIFDGDTAHFVDYVGAGVDLETGMVVEVTRYRDGGSLREITLKEVEVTPRGITLWARSHNPVWKDPIRLETDDGQDIEVQITGLLLNAFRNF